MLEEGQQGERKEGEGMNSKEERRKERQAVYNTPRWKQLRNLKIQESPLCEDCLKEGRVTPAEEVHHIKSFCVRGISEEEKYRRAYDYNNLVALCKDCHHKRHGTYNDMREKILKYS